MPKTFVQYIDGNNLFTCTRCNSHLSSLSFLVSKAFRGQHGTAFLFNQVVNIIHGKHERKQLATGYHTVCDIFCVVCNHSGFKEPVGWKYISAQPEDQKYKEGKYILEEQLIDKQNWVDD